ncbi:MAG: UDP-N-acetylmuramoyl-L-alanine--D-glutamate ligase, partial [Chloroflexota bacterium]|nr:UDP-N-acetylmuramoyl-L-alanine--D-glutamate ligase [Chloroflexota bacterium]
MDIAGRHALILGLAREGVSLARFLSKQGALVTVTDSASPERLKDQQQQAAGTARFVLGGDHPELVDGADLFFVSPGVPEENAVYQAAIDRGLSVQSMTTLFFTLCPAPIVGITGSSGKTTTTGLIG